jgi:hypothetical protein
MNERLLIYAQVFLLALWFLFLCFVTPPEHRTKPPPSICPELIAKHQSTGVPAHITIKCKEFLK